MINNKSIIKVYIVLAIVLGFFALAMGISYFTVFHRGFSHEPSDWEAFGCYFSAVFTLANLVFFIIITIYVARMQDETSQRQLSHERKMQRINFQWNRLEELNHILEGLQELAIERITVADIESVYVNAWRTRRAIHLFKDRAETLFDTVDFADSVKAIDDFATAITKLRDKYKLCVKKDKTISADEATALTAALRKSDTSLISLSRKLQYVAQSEI